MHRKNKNFEINNNNSNNNRRSAEQRHIIKLNEARLAHSPSHSPVRDNSEYGYSIHDSNDLFDPTDIVLKQKWLDNSPRMSKLRDHRQKRLLNKLEQFELWDIEQEQKHKQYEIARDQRYRNIMERLKSQEFCVNVMKKRHESDLEMTRELELYGNEHLYVDPLDDKESNIEGPVSQYRKFSAEMDEKAKSLQNDFDSLNPRPRIQQTILPRLERTRELYSVEPDIYTKRGKRVLKKPNLREDSFISYYSSPNPSLFNRSTSTLPRLKPIIHSYHDDSIRALNISRLKISDNDGLDTKKSVYFNDDIIKNGVRV